MRSVGIEPTTPCFGASFWCCPKIIPSSKIHLYKYLYLFYKYLSNKSSFVRYNILQYETKGKCYYRLSYERIQCSRLESNQRRVGLQPTALPSELPEQIFFFVFHAYIISKIFLFVNRCGCLASCIAFPLSHISHKVPVVVYRIN